MPSTSFTAQHYFLLFGQVRRPATRAAAGRGHRGFAPQPQPRPSCVTRRGLYAASCGGEGSSDMPTPAEGITLAAALAVAAGGTLGFGALCQVKSTVLSQWSNCGQTGAAVPWCRDQCE